MDFMFDWDNDGDRFSFDDSERFEEESMCSWMSETESLNNNWRGWKRQNGGQTSPSYNKAQEGEVLSLVELASQTVACNIPYGVVEKYPQPIPEPLQLRITFWSFPDCEEDIRLYSCLANGSAEEFQKGDHLYKSKSVKNALQIGFHLSATVAHPTHLSHHKGSFQVAILFDRRRISQCTCTCNSNALWCSHVVAVCLFRIHQPGQVTRRVPVSESLTQLHRDQLQKFAQYLIAEMPKEILPIAQGLLDKLISAQECDMNTHNGAPDPTAGAEANEETSWCLDEKQLHENVKKTLVKFCVPSPVVFSDVNFLTQTAPPAAAEWQSLLRPLRGREPEGMWNLLSIAREMFRRSDHNAIPLLEIITDEILIWWFMTKITNNNNNQLSSRSSSNSSASITQHAASSLCDEIVNLWKLAALNPKLSPVQKDELCAKFKEWHLSTIEKVKRARNSSNSGSAGGTLKKSEIENFAGFKPGIEACILQWDDYHIPGVTYSDSQKLSLHYRFNRVLDSDAKKPSRIQPMAVCSENLISTDDTTTLAEATNMLNEHHSPQDMKNKRHRHPSRQGHSNNDGAMSSGSEGFCEPERGSSLFRDSDSGSEMKEPNFRRNSLDDAESFRLYNLNIQESKQQNYNQSVSQSDSHENDDDVLMELGGNASANGETGGGVAGPDQPGDGAQAQGESLFEAQLSGDEYSLYVYDRAKAIDMEKKRKEKNNEEPNYFAAVKCLENRQDISFARAEALHAHGHTKEACKLAQQLAEDLLANPPDLLAETAAVPNIKGKRKKALTNITLLTSTTLSKAAFLAGVLLEEQDTWHLAFHMGMFVLEMPRPPASCKAMEVKLAYQETELLSLLKKIPLGPAEMSMLRQRADQLKDGTIKSRGEALLPLTLASFIFDALCLGACPMTSTMPGCRHVSMVPCMKANVSEADHPLLCESTRKQRGDLTMAMLLNYKDDIAKLSKIMDKLLDKEVHQQYKAPSLMTYLTPRQAPCHTPTTSTGGSRDQQERPQNPRGASGTSRSTRTSELDEFPAPDDQRHRGGASGGLGTTGARPKAYTTITYGLSSAVEEEGDNYKQLEAKLRCMALKKKPSSGRAAIDSSAPETTSSDNSPTLVRRVWGKHQGPGSDSGSSGDSDSLGSSSSGDKAELRTKLRDESSQAQINSRITATSQFILDSRSSTPNLKGIRFKGKRIMPTVPNQPSEASAHWMWEVAKMILNKAGGSSSTSQFIQPSNTNQPSGPHRNLQLCSFQIGLYALGLQNCVAPNWLSRTYSSHVSWITGQAMEIGSAAIHILIDTWEGHLTPPEVASLADRASRGRDHHIVRAAAELALSCLPQAHALNPSEVQRALYQCKEQSKEMLEKACLAVEGAATGGGVYPEVLFHVAKRWHELAEEAASQPGGVESGRADGHERGRPRSAPLAPVTVSSPSQGAEGPSPVNLPVIPFSNTPPNASHVAVSAAQLLTHNGQPVMLPFPMPPVPQPSPHHPHHHMQQQQAFVQPYNIVQQIHQPFGAPPLQQSIPMHPQTMPPYVTFTYPNPIQYNGMPQQAPVYSSAAAYRPMAPGPIPTQAQGQGVQVIPSQNCQMSNLPGMLPPPPQAPLSMAHPPNMSGEDIGHHHTLTNPHIMNPTQTHYLHAAFRVGILAMETLARRVHDERPQTKYAKNPPNGEDVKWLLKLAMKLGTSYLQQFTQSVANAVVSPFLLYDIAIEAAQVLARNNPVAVQSHLRSGILHPLVQKCVQMFIQCAHQRIHHINPSEYDDFVSIICSARNVFYITPGGMVQFQELLQSLRRTKSCRKELWQRIMNGLATPVSL
ncbi:ZSWM8-like protein [Mya arenaria]|uniref:ZSWM8-like protein n=1 Tax=Mya arenaria TaxID=6604 RepID=A0ABY7DLB9_MYAAR|nr:ZSWM8-like protein [Mya arenaria]